MMHQSKNFFQVLPEMEKDILDFLSAERLTVYQRGRHIQAYSGDIILIILIISNKYVLCPPK